MKEKLMRDLFRRAKVATEAFWMNGDKNVMFVKRYKNRKSKMKIISTK